MHRTEAVKTGKTMNDYKLFRTLHDVGMIYVLARLAVFMSNYGFQLGTAISIGVAGYFALSWLLHIGLEDEPDIEVEMDAFCRYILGLMFLGIAAFSIYAGLYILLVFSLVGAIGAFGVGWIGHGFSHFVARCKK